MALSFENNSLSLNNKVIELPDRIIETLSINDIVVILIDYHFDKREKKFNYNGGNVFCYDKFGNFKWQWDSKGVMKIWAERNELHIYDTSSLGYDCTVDIETGNILKAVPKK